MGFSLDIAAFAKKAGVNANQVVRKVVMDIGTSVVEKTPVGDATYWQSPPPKGYVGGHARANWSHSMGILDQKEFADIDKSGGASVSRIAQSLSSTPAGQVHFIQNSLPYIQRLEDGWSRQAPYGMVSTTVVEFQNFVNQAVGGLK